MEHSIEKIEKYEKLLKKFNWKQSEGKVSEPTNTIARIFNKESTENFISDWIAFLIDPNTFGTTEILNALLKTADCNFQISENENVSVEREKIFNDHRRIDFYIETEEIIIGIENKIWSDLGNNQLEDYVKSLDKICKELGKKESVKILLYPQENKCQKIMSILKSDKDCGFITITYEQFIEALKDLKINFVDNLRSAFLLQDFITYVEEYIMTDNFYSLENFKWIEFYKDNAQIIEELERQNKTMKRIFTDGLIKKLADKYAMNEKWEITGAKSGSYIQIYHANSKVWGELVHFELVMVGKFPYTDIQVTLHSKEGMDPEGLRTEELNNLENKATEFIKQTYGNNKFEIDYSNVDNYEKSINKVIDVVDAVIKEYEGKIENEIMENKNT